MTYLADNSGRPMFGGLKLQAPVVSTPPSGSPIEMPSNAWAVSDSSTDSKFDYELTSAYDDVKSTYSITNIYLRAGSTSEPWEEITNAVGTYTSSFTVPTGIPIKVWIRLVNASGESETEYYKEVTVVNAAPIVTNVTPTPTSTTLNVGWTTNTGSGTGYCLVDQTASHTGSEVEAGGTFDDSAAVSASGAQPTFSITGLTAETSYYVHVVHKVGSEYSNVVSTAFTTEAAPTGTVVSSYEQAQAAVDGGASNILVAPGTYTYNGANGWIQLLKNLDRTNNPLTFQSQDPSNPAIFVNQAFNMSGSHYITVKNITSKNNGGWGRTASHFSDNNGASSSNLTFDNITIDGSGSWAASGLSITSPTSPSSSYGNQVGETVANAFRFNQDGTKNITIKNCNASYVWIFFECPVNGDITVENNTIDIWYWDCFNVNSKYSLGDYTTGNRIFAYNKILRTIGYHNEIQQGDPHMDAVQMQGPPFLENILFYQNIFASGDGSRASYLQGGLQNVPTKNIAYVENVWLTKNAPHGVWYDGNTTIYRQGLHERCTYGCAVWNSATSIRVRSNGTGHILVKDTLARAFENQSTTGKLILELRNSATYSSYSNTFSGPSGPNTGAEALTAFTPLTNLSGRGALTTEGEFRNLPHVPTMPGQPGLTGGSGQYTIDSVTAPTLMSPKQVSQGGHTITRWDTQWSTSGNNGTWTVVTNKGAGDTVTGVSSGTIYVSVRAVNSAGEGVWSEPTTVVVS